MHLAAYDWVARHAVGGPVAVLDIGGRDVNGTVRGLFPAAAVYTVVDVRPGRNVDIVADAALWKPDRAYDVVVCTEVFEHTLAWRNICMTAYQACKAGGSLLATCAGPGRAPHSGIDGGAVRFGEWYENIDPGELRDVLEKAGWVDVVLDQAGEDVRAHARAPRTRTGK